MTMYREAFMFPPFNFGLTLKDEAGQAKVYGGLKLTSLGPHIMLESKEIKDM